MRVFLLILIISCFSIINKTNAQLTANAGPDTVVCDAAHYPYLGGTPAALGGTPPYTYEWIYNADPGNSFFYIDNLYSPKPRVRLTSSAGDTMVFTLTVRDNTGALATDIVRVLVARWNCTTNQCIKTKTSTDTIMISESCYGNFPPNTIRWSPVNKLSDSTIASPLTWTDVSTNYVAKLSNAIGCWRYDTCKVNVQPATVKGLDKVYGYIAMNPHPVNETSVFTVSNDMLGGELKVYTIDGKILLKQTIVVSNTLIGDKLPHISGMYFYSYEKQGAKAKYGKWVSE